MRIEIRDSQLPDSEPKLHELVVTTYESPDGHTRHHQVIAMSDDDLVGLYMTAAEHLGKMPEVGRMIHDRLLAYKRRQGRSAATAILPVAS